MAGIVTVDAPVEAPPPVLDWKREADAGATPRPLLLQTSVLLPPFAWDHLARARAPRRRRLSLVLKREPRRVCVASATDRRFGEEPAAAVPHEPVSTLTRKRPDSGAWPLLAAGRRR